MVKILPIKQRSQDWYDLRKIKLGASCAPVICGISIYMTAFELYQEMKGIAEPQKENWGMERGKELEEEAVQLYENSEGFETFDPVGESEIHDCLFASMDAVCVDDYKKCAEIKCLNIEDHSKTYIGDIPSIYFPQLQHQMFVFDLEQIAYVSYNPNALIEYTKTIIKRDDAWLKEYIPKALAFMDCIYTNTPPKKTEKDWYDCSNDESFEHLSETYMMAYNEYQLAEDKKERARKELIAYADGKKVKGTLLKVSKHIKQGQVQYNKIPIVQKIDLDMYRGPSIESYRIDRVK